MIHDITALANEVREARASVSLDVSQAELKLSSSMPSKFENTPSHVFPARRIQNPEHLTTLERQPGRPMSFSPPSLILVRASHSKGRNAECAANCRCDCHRTSLLRSPPFLDRVLGKLFIGYSGCPAGLVSACNEVSCHSGLASSAQVTYIFPSWFSNRLVSLTLETSRMGDPSLNLSVYRGIPTGSKIFQFTSSQDIEGLRSLFIHGLASPKDVDNQYGYTALQVSKVRF